MFVIEMKRIISISLLSLMLSYSFNQLGIFVEYITDIEAFTELYCENKDKPDMNCNGKCHLTEQLAENEEQKQNKELQAPTEIILYYAPSNIELIKEAEFFVERNSVFYFNPDLTEGISHMIFHPPQV